MSVNTVVEKDGDGQVWVTHLRVSHTFFPFTLFFLLSLLPNLPLSTPPFNLRSRRRNYCEVDESDLIREVLIYCATPLTCVRMCS